MVSSAKGTDRVTRLRVRRIIFFSIPFQVLAAMERLDVAVKDVKAAHFKTDDISTRMRALLGDASLAQHSLATEQPVGASCLVSGVVVVVVLVPPCRAPLPTAEENCVCIAY